MKFYAVRQGRVPGIYHDWDKCRIQIDGFKGAEFKSFPTEAEAKQYLGVAKITKEITQECLKKYDAVAYVDGSYLAEKNSYSSGVVLMNGLGGIVSMESFSGSDPDYVSMRNVAGEILAASYAISYAYRNKFSKLMIFYDYAGLEKWCTGEWFPRKSATQRYKELFTQAMMDSLTIDFQKIKSHSDNAWNDLADLLAKRALGIVSRDEVTYHIVKSIDQIYKPPDYDELAGLLLTKAAGYIIDIAKHQGYISVEDSIGRTINYTRLEEQE